MLQHFSTRNPARLFRARRIQSGSLLLGMVLSFGAAAGELGDLLQATLQHPQLRAATNQTAAAQAQADAVSGRYLGSAVLSSGWHRYEGQRVVGVFTPGTPMVPLISERIVQSGVNYSLPVDLFGVIAASRERAKQDLAASELLGRQQALLKLHQAASAYLSLQALLKQRAALALSVQRVQATYRRTLKEVELGKAAGVDARYAESELARLAADDAVLNGALTQAQADLAEASGQEKLLPTAGEIRVPAWEDSSEVALPLQIAQARHQAAQAQADEARRALLPSLSLDANYFRNNVPGGDHRDTWAVGGVISLPLGVSQYQQAKAQGLNAQAAAEQSEAARRDSERQLAGLHAAYDAALVDAAAMEKETDYREQVAQVQQEMQRLGNQTLENLFRHERDLLDARYRLAQARARAAAAWSAAQVVNGLPVETYIARMDGL
ncbi:MAG: TolC family protein [Sulfuricella sp.]|nr:TolC family protein [Sulfuricella sp.]